MRQKSHIGATDIEDTTQTHNNRISTASAGCNVSHNAMCLSNYPLNIIVVVVKFYFCKLSKDAGLGALSLSPVTSL